MIGGQGTDGSKGSAVLPAKTAVRTSVFLCRGSRGAYARPGCLWLPQHLLVQHVHDEDASIGTCVSEGKLREQAGKRAVSRAAGEQAVGWAVATRAPLCSAPERSLFFPRDQQVCASDNHMCAHSGMLLWL